MYYDSVLNTRMVLAAAGEVGLDGAALLDAAGIRAEVLADPFANVPAARQFALLEAALEGSGDRAFGLRMAGCWNRPGAMDAVGYHIAASGTFRDMIETGYEALRRFSNLQDVRLEQRDGEARIVYRPAQAEWRLWPVLLDFYMASVAIQGRLLIHADLAPVQAVFVGSPPARRDPYESLFRCPLRFEHSWGLLQLEPRWLDAPSRRADPALSHLIGDVLGEHARSPQPTAALVARTRGVLGDMLRDGVPTLGALAAQMRMRPRTLQHQLGREGITFSALVDEARRELVLSLLRQSTATLDEIAWRAGYRSQSSFHRSFRRWTGGTPSAYRRGIQGR